MSAARKFFPLKLRPSCLHAKWLPTPLFTAKPIRLPAKIVCADVQMRGTHDEADARRTIRKFCAQKLEPFKVPVKIRFVDGGLTSDRLKRMRIGRDEQPQPE